jgi:hypothetical protein
MIYYENPVPVSKETYYVFTTKPNRLMLFGETVAVYCEDEATLRLTVSQSVSRYVLVSTTIAGLATRYYLLSEICGLVSVGRPL